MALNSRWTSHLGACGGARPNASHTKGAVLTGAQLEKERKHHELLVSERYRLVVVATETGGRWSKEAADFINSLAEVKARDAPPLGDGGPGCWRCPAGGRSRHLCSLLVPQALTVKADIRPTWPSCLQCEALLT